MSPPIPDVVASTERLVEVDTAPGRSTAGAVDLVRERARSLGGDVTVQRARHDGVEQLNVVARFGGDAPAGLVLAGHLDTVPWEPGTRATTAPERDGRRLFGRGTCDMKGAIAAQLDAAARTAQARRRPLVLAYTFAEEIGCHGAVHLLACRADLGALEGARAIVGEPTDFAPVVAHKGYGVARIRLRGAPAHSSDPWSGVDASEALGVLLVGLHELRGELRAEAPADSIHAPPGTTLNTGLVRCGTAANVVPGAAEIALEFREEAGADHAALVARVEQRVDRARAAAPGLQAEIEWPNAHPAFAQPRDEALVSWLHERTAEAPTTVPFYTEAELYRRGLGVPTVVLGPGSIALAHRVDESIGFDELERGAAVYADAIVRFCG